ncbi:MAG: malate dehydrogenase [Candidatus Omnitrophica bacterium]|nr:malate dehydrogenase [Candidatus Omnitrophota bacterium]
MKISIIGAGNVGALSAMRLAEIGFDNITLIDIAKGIAYGKAMDIEDTQALLKMNYHLRGSEDINQIRDSDIILITAGFARKPGMTREELLAKNAQILKGISAEIKKLSSEAIIVVVTNPLDLMTYFVLKSTGFATQRVIGMGISLDAARFANLISKELNIPVNDIEPYVIGSHGEGMLPLARLTKIKGVELEEFMDDKKIESLIRKTINRGAEIVAALGSTSAYFAPSAAAANLVKAIAKDEKRVIGVCAYLSGEYGLKDICIGVPCRIGRNGIEKIIELELNTQEKESLQKSAQSVSQNIKLLKSLF